MNLLILLLISAIIVLIFASQVAGRLDRLHRRVSSVRSTLWRRCNERYEIVHKIPNIDIQNAAAKAKRLADQEMFSDEHLYAESELTRILKMHINTLDMQSAQIRLQDARRMYNEAVRATLYLRSWRISRWLRLSGRAIAPKYVDFDDSYLNEN